ncbi:acetate kinase [Sulfurimonas sp. HSL-1716]|uniref:acetate/propionate family kinase n=1 Tax=Hydrocurvibacter sulfurireducens TaxID=3131937 RepID=UPI0031F79DC1
MQRRGYREHGSDNRYTSGAEQLKALILNSGSSSIKYKIFDMESENILDKGIIEELKGNRHKELEKIIKGMEKIDFIAHRVVHGGDSFKTATIIDDAVIKEIDALSHLAPLHNPANLDGILTAKQLAPDVLQIAVFDTAFHEDMEPWAYMYAMPQELYTKYSIRRYGFHGTSHSYLLKECAKLLNKKTEETNLISLHLGNGASASAVKNGKSYDTSMGFTPLEGLVMGTRSGDFDPAILLYLLKLGFSEQELDDLVNQKSGLLGLCGSSDLREILNRDDHDAKLALEIMSKRVKKYLGAYVAVLGRVDAIVFSGGIGENSPQIRKMILEGLDEAFDILLDDEKNSQTVARTALISKEKSRIPLYVIPTDEEIEIAHQAFALLR